MHRSARYYALAGALLLAAAMACQQLMPTVSDFLLGVLYGVVKVIYDIGSEFIS
jgi:ABC-type enterobactin transport system permease subunit